MSDFMIYGQGLQVQLLLQFAVGSRAISGSTPPPSKIAATHLQLAAVCRSQLESHA